MSISGLQFPEGSPVSIVLIIIKPIKIEGGRSYMREHKRLIFLTPLWDMVKTLDSTKSITLGPLNTRLN